jgi:hypothetical protein
MRAIASAPEEAVRHSCPQRPKSRLNVSNRSSSSSTISARDPTPSLLSSRFSGLETGKSDTSSLGSAGGGWAERVGRHVVCSAARQGREDSQSREALFKARNAERAGVLLRTGRCLVGEARAPRCAAWMPRPGRTQNPGRLIDFRALRTHRLWHLSCTQNTNREDVQGRAPSVLRCYALAHEIRFTDEAC